MYWNQFTPSSPFYSSHTPSERLYNLRCAAPVSHSSSTVVRKTLHFTDDIFARFDRIGELGGADSSGEEIGHAGCVNALAWSQSGHCLATGSDDRKVILWKLGGSDDHPSNASLGKPQGAVGRSYPQVDLAQSDVIETGHRANIFNVKWAPNCSDRRLFTCAGDNQVRVFDLSRATTTAAIDRSTSSGREYRLWQQGQGACTRVLRCHSSRAKKISTENSPDIFLTAAEDGEVRQMDLRVPHTCSRSQNYGQGCPRPLVQFQMELYSLSVSKLEPWLFAVSGSSDKVYLQDRRMIPRLLKKEWGSYIDEEIAALTHCVRRFTREPPSDSSSPLARKVRRAHITAVKISEANGRDMLASFSGDGVYRFDIRSEIGLPKEKEESEKTHLHSSKRLKTANCGGETAGQGQCRGTFDGDNDCESIRKAVVSLLFLQGADNRVTRRYSKMLAELDQMEDLINSMARPAKWLAREWCVIAMCRLLVQIRRATAGLVETVDIDFTSLKEGLEADLTEEAREFVIPLLDEMEEANKWRAYSEEVKIRVLLWARAEEYIRAWWLDAWPEVEMKGNEVAMDSQLPQTAECSVSDLPKEEADSLVPTTEWSLGYLDGQSSVDSNIDDDEEEQEQDEDEDEDEDEEMLVDSSSEESCDDDDDEDRNKHGISGGDAAIAYPRSSYTGHANVETVKDCGFLGSNDEYIWSGSDCGHFFIWSNDAAGKLLGLWKGDGSVVNVLAQHPSLPICAVSGIDETVKIFGPVSRGSIRVADAFGRKDEIMRRNSEQEGSVGFSSQSLMRLFARHMAAAQEIPLPMARQTEAGEGQDDDCIIA